MLPKHSEFMSNISDQIKITRSIDKGVRLYIPFSVIGQGVMITPHKIMKLIILSVDFNNKNHCDSEKF